VRVAAAAAAAAALWLRCLVRRPSADTCTRRGCRDAYGGAPAYLSWAAAAGESNTAVTAPDASPFFTSPFCKAAFKAHVRAVLTRKNTYSGIAYADDPAILGYDLMNEPRVPADPSGDTLHVRCARARSRSCAATDSRRVSCARRGSPRWRRTRRASTATTWSPSAQRCAAAWRALLQAPMLSIMRPPPPPQGFFGASTPELMSNNPAGDNGTGNDFVRHHLIPDIDFSTIHVWCAHMAAAAHPAARA
jgi:hypothetical protein